MPDNSPHYTWPQFARDALNVLQILALAYVARLGNVNHAQVEQKATEIVQKQDAAEVKVDKVRTKLDARTAKDDKATEVTLKASWKYLEGVAEESGLQKDRDRANDAKRVLDEFVAHKNGN